MQEFVARAGSPQRAAGFAIGLIVVVILLIALLVSLLGGDDNGGADIPATETPVGSILIPTGIGTPGASTPAVDDTTDAPTTAPTTSTGPDRDTLVTPTMGSDNVLDQIGQPTPAEGASTGPPTTTCSQACLVRIANAPNAQEMLSQNGTRPSYTGENWLWAIAEPAAVANISSTTNTDVVRESSETLSLYMVTVPEGVAEQGAVQLFGKVLDSVDNRRLVEVGKVPPNVRVVLDTGLIVEKVAPAPPSSMDGPRDRQTLEEAGVGTLTAGVDDSRIAAAIQELQGIGSTDGTGVGTRYYTTPGNQLAADMLFTSLESYGMNVWYEDFVTPEGLLLVNVIGEVAGADPSRIYGVMAHFDSTSDLPTAAAPGADDNASGVTATLEISRILAPHELRYSYRAVFINAEEVGILGADAFASEAIAQGVPWEGIFNLDSVGSSRNGDQIVLNATGESVWMEDLVFRVNDGYDLGLPLTMLQDPEIVADDTRLRAQGVESVLIARELYGWSPIHHTENDVYANLSLQHVEAATELILLTVASLLQ
ncbi:MAG: M28 family peptidase [Chloroflexota bacterium]|nr:M28 family peptidase [Chloroflexota bacterium]